MGHDLLTWQKQLLHNCKCRASSSSIATATRNKFHHTIKRSNIILVSIISTNLVDFEFLMLYTKIQPQSFLSSGVQDFDCVGV